jgi:1-acyl-sn-glycerol-3-phosphate acyltransferase
MNKLFGYILTPIHYLLFGILVLLFHPIQWLCFKLAGQEAHKKSVDLLNFFLLCTYYIMGSRIKFKNPYDLPINRPIIFIANHQSMYDIPALIWFLRRYHAKFISKIELTKGIPSVSFNLKYGGGANIDRKDSKQAVSEIIKLAERMQKFNWSTVIFPEGTRAKNGQLKPFSVGGVATLLKKVPNALIVPIAINGSWKLVQYGKFPLSAGQKITWEVLEPIEPDNKTMEEIVNVAEKAIKNALK